jgi:hypothetical protein
VDPSFIILLVIGCFIRYATTGQRYVAPEAFRYFLSLLQAFRDGEGRKGNFFIFLSLHNLRLILLIYRAGSSIRCF